MQPRKDGIEMKSRRIAALCAALAFVATSAPFVRESSAATSINASDIKALGGHLLNKGTSLSRQVADKNNDTRINAADMTVAKRIALGLYTPEVSGAYPLLINEVCAVNSSVLVDKNGDYGDWIEIYNCAKSGSVNLSGLGLSDNPDKPFKYVFPDVSIAAGEYLVVFASDPSDNDGSEIHTGFNLSSEGEYVVLTHPTAGTLDSVEFPPLSEDITYGRYANASQNFEVLTPTPGRSNDSAQIAQNQAKLAAPVFSKKSGFYDGEFTLTVSAPAGTTVYYTTDCTNPTASSTRYSSGIRIYDRSNEENVYSMTPDTSVYSDYVPTQKIDKAMVVRAIAVDSDGNVSNISTATYFVGNDYAQKYKDFAVMSVVSDPDNLYDYDTGIYVKGAVYDEYKNGNQNPWGGDDNPWGGMGGIGGWPGMQDDGSTPANYNQRGREWERAAYFDFFDNSHKLVISSDCGIRIHGGYSRAYLQKSLRFIARKEYGSGKFKAALIPGLVKNSDGVTPLEEFDTFVMRNGGNAWDYVKFKCAYIQKLLEDRSFDTQDSNPVVSYLDGEYWGLYMIREDFDDNYIANNYDIPKEDAIIIKVGSVDEGDETTDKALYDELISYASNNDMTVRANYEKMCSMIDVQSLADYYAAEIFIANTDWPHNNYRLWRSRSVDPSNPFQDGKWRFMLYDTEMSMDLYDEGKNYSTNTLQSVMSGGGFMMGGTNHTVIFKKLMENEEFKRIFVNAILDITNINFEYDRAMELLKYYENLYMPLIEEQYERFASNDIKGSSTEHVTKEIEGMRYYIKNRSEYIPTMLKQTLKLTGNANKLTISAASGGTVKVNSSVLDLSDGSWTGSYFADFPITVTAIPESGKTFTGWSGASTSTSQTITVTVSEAMNLQAQFR